MMSNNDELAHVTPGKSSSSRQYDDLLENYEKLGEYEDDSSMDENISSNLTGTNPEKDMRIEICDRDGIWSPASVIEMYKTSYGHEWLTTVRYDGWGAEWDETVPWPSTRLARLYTYTKEVKCFLDTLPSTTAKESHSKSSKARADAKSLSPRFWPCRVQFRMPHPGCGNAEQLLRLERNVFVKPYGQTIPRDLRAVLNNDGIWFEVSRLNPWMDDVEGYKTSKSFQWAWKEAKRDRDTAVLPVNPIEEGSLLNHVYRVHKVGGEAVDGVKYCGGFPRKYTPQQLPTPSSPMKHHHPKPNDQPMEQAIDQLNDQQPNDQPNDESFESRVLSELKSMKQEIQSLKLAIQSLHNAVAPETPQPVTPVTTTTARRKLKLNTPKPLKPLTLKQQENLSEAMERITDDKLQGLVRILRQHNVDIGDEEDVSLDIDQMDPKAQKAVHQYVMKNVKRRRRTPNSSKRKTPPVQSPVTLPPLPPPQKKKPAPHYEFYRFSEDENSFSTIPPVEPQIYLDMQPPVALPPMPNPSLRAPPRNIPSPIPSFLENFQFQDQPKFSNALLLSDLDDIDEDEISLERNWVSLSGSSPETDDNTCQPTETNLLDNSISKKTDGREETNDVQPATAGPSSVRVPNLNRKIFRETIRKRIESYKIDSKVKARFYRDEDGDSSCCEDFGF